MSATTNRQWLLASRPAGLPTLDNFQSSSVAIGELDANQVLVRVVYLSLDPTNRIWMNEADSYVPAIPLGHVMRGVGLGFVVDSKNPSFAAGDLVQGMLGWQEYYVSPNGRDLNKLPNNLPVPLDAHFGLLGHIGFTSYFGVLDIGKPKEGETLVVSAAAGAVGSIAGQIGKIKGCRVVGIAGSDDKCKWLVDELGFDAAVNYRKGNLYQDLKAACPKGIDIYFENVGGAILETVLSLVNINVRIPLCGMISQYNASKPEPGPPNLATLVMHRGLMQGFLVMDYAPRFAEATRDLVTWHAQGKIKYRTDIVKGLENAPAALLKLFDGSNTGKLLIEVSQPAL